MTALAQTLDPSLTGADSNDVSLATSTPRTPAEVGFDNSVGLTEREVEIVSRIATGMSNQQIGSSIFVSVNTVKSYIRSAYRKMNVETRSQAVVWAFNHALVAPVLTEAVLATQQARSTSAGVAA